METNTPIEIAKDNILICKNVKPLDGNDVAPPLNLEEEYTALDITTCGCGKKHIDVGLKSKYSYVRCYDCEETLPADIHWCHPSRFEIKS